MMIWGRKAYLAHFTSTQWDEAFVNTGVYLSTVEFMIFICVYIYIYTGVPSTPKLICSSSDLDTKESDIALTCFSTLCTIAARIDTLILHIVTFSTELFSVGDFFFFLQIAPPQ